MIAFGLASDRMKMQQACSDWSKFAARVFLMFFSDFRGQQTRYKIMQFFCFSKVSVKLLCFLSLSTPIPYVNFAFFCFVFPWGRLAEKICGKVSKEVQLKRYVSYSLF